MSVNTYPKLTRLPPPRLTRPVSSFLPGSLFPTVRPAGGVFGRWYDGKEAGSRISAVGRRGEVQASCPGGTAIGHPAGHDRSLPMAAAGPGDQPGRVEMFRPHRRVRRWRGSRPGHSWPRLHPDAGNQPAGRTAIGSGDRQAGGAGAGAGSRDEVRACRPGERGLDDARPGKLESAGMPWADARPDAEQECGATIRMMAARQSG